MSNDADLTAPQPFLRPFPVPNLFPMLEEEVDDQYDACYPLTEDGRPFQYIGSVPGWLYRDSGAGLILLFWDPVSRIALETFDWT